MGSRKTVLLVEDEIDLQALAKVLLESEFDLFAVKRWADAEQLLERLQPDLCVMDMCEDVRNDLERITELLQSRDIPFAFHTGDTEFSEYPGAIAVLHKPEDMLNVESVQNLIKRSS